MVSGNDDPADRIWKIQCLDAVGADCGPTGYSKQLRRGHRRFEAFGDDQLEVGVMLREPDGSPLHRPDGLALFLLRQVGLARTVGLQKCFVKRDLLARGIDDRREHRGEIAAIAMWTVLQETQNRRYCLIDI